MEVFLPLAGVVLGALIAGLFTLLANRYNFERQNRKDILNQKNKNLDEIVTYAIEYFSYGDALLAAIDGVSKDIELNGRPYSDARSFLDKHDIEFVGAAGAGRPSLGLGQGFAPAPNSFYTGRSDGPANPGPHSLVWNS